MTRNQEFYTYFCHQSSNYLQSLSISKLASQVVVPTGNGGFKANNDYLIFFIFVSFQAYTVNMGYPGYGMWMGYGMGGMGGLGYGGFGGYGGYLGYGMPMFGGYGMYG